MWPNQEWHFKDRRATKGLTPSWNILLHSCRFSMIASTHRGDADMEPLYRITIATNDTWAITGCGQAAVMFHLDTVRISKYAKNCPVSTSASFNLLSMQHEPSMQLRAISISLSSELNDCRSGLFVSLWGDTAILHINIFKHLVKPRLDFSHNVAP